MQNIDRRKSLKEVKLTATEERKMENQQQMFILLRVINLIEKAYNQDKIDSDTYQEQIVRQLDKYDKFRNQLDNFDLQEFMTEFGVKEECSWAEYRINQGAPQEQRDQTKLLVNITSKFSEALDMVTYNKSRPQVSLIKPAIEDLVLYLKKARSTLGSDFEPTQLISKLLDEVLNSKEFSDLLSEDEVEKLEEVLQYSYEKFLKTMNK